MDGTPEPSGSILEWDELDVHIWLSRLGLPQYEAQIKGMSFSLLSLFCIALVSPRPDLKERIEGRRLCTIFSSSCVAHLALLSYQLVVC